MSATPAISIEHDRHKGIAALNRLGTSLRSGNRSAIADIVWQSAANLVAACNLDENEQFALITDSDVLDKNLPMVVAIQQLTTRVSRTFRLFVEEPAERSAVPFSPAVADYLTTGDPKCFIILTRMSRTWSEQTQIALKRGGRCISITKGTRPEVLTEGAILEPLDVLKARGDDLATLMEHVVEMHISTALGTNMIIPLRPYGSVETGVLQPGSAMNAPWGEGYWMPAQEGSNGAIVVHDAPMGGAIPREMMDGQTVCLIVQNGILTQITGDDPGTKLKEYLEAGRTGDAPNQNPFRIAEFGVGINTKAWRDINGQRKLASTSVEGEKAYGTVHIAFGANGLYPGLSEDDPERTKVEVHADCVILEPTVDCTRADGSSFTLIEEGHPIGY